jgi:hypothetical protein
MSDATSDPPKGPHEPDPPDLDLVVVAAQRLRAIVRDPDRSTRDKRRAIDALGRALVRLKKSL